MQGAEILECRDTGPEVIQADDVPGVAQRLDNLVGFFQESPLSGIDLLKGGFNGLSAGGTSMLASAASKRSANSTGSFPRFLRLNRAALGSNDGRLPPGRYLPLSTA